MRSYTVVYHMIHSIEPYVFVLSLPLQTPVTITFIASIKYQQNLNLNKNMTRQMEGPSGRLNKNSFCFSMMLSKLKEKVRLDVKHHPQPVSELIMIYNNFEARGANVVEDFGYVD